MVWIRGRTAHSTVLQLTMKTLLINVLVALAIVTQAGADDPILGAIYPLTGPAAEIGEQRLRGAQIALEELSATKQLHFQFSVEDSQSDPKTAVSSFKKLSDGKEPAAIFTALSSVSMALKPLAEARKIILFANSTHPDITKDSTFTLRSYFTVEGANDTVFEQSRAQNFKTFALLFVDDEFGNALADDFQQRSKDDGLIVTVAQSFQKSESDFRTVLAKVAATKPDALFVVGLGNAIAQAAKQAKELHAARNIIVWAGCSQVGLRTTESASFEGVLSVDPSVDETSKEYLQLQAGFAAKYPGEILSPIAVAEYDAVKIFGEVWPQVTQGKTAIRTILTQHGPFNGASGKVEFNSSGDAKWPMQVSRMEKGACRRL